MKSVLILCLATLAGATSWSLNERASSVPTGVQRQRPRLVLPKTIRRDMQRLFYLKHLLELNCLRHMCNGGQCKRLKCPSAAKSADRNPFDKVYRNRITNNHYREPPPYMTPNNKMIVVPPNIYFINPRVENLPQMAQNIPKGGKQPVKQNTDSIVYIQLPQQNEETRPPEDQYPGKNGDMQRSSSETPAYFHWQEPPPDHHQYEVKEIIDEDSTYQEQNPVYVIQKATDEALAEEFQNRSNVLVNDRNSSSTTENVRNFSLHKSRELVEEKTPEIQQEKGRYIKITPYNRVLKTQTTEQPINSGTTLFTGKKDPDMSALPSDLFEFLTDQPETDKSTPDNRKPATMSFSEIQTTAKVVSKGLRELITTAKTDSDTEWNFPEDPNTSPSMVNMVKTVKYFSEATINKGDLTTPDFQEFSDHPLLVDLLPKAKPKDTETAWKNSRKMHFGDTPKTDRDPEQRRSDILINESDYYDDENNLSTSNYLENLKGNSSLLSFDLPENPSPEEIIPLIPVVIGDLREGKIPQESLPVLSEMFGKYWPAVLALSNSTNLDMLPLLKMKNEKDLESIMESVLPENSGQATTTTTTTTEKTEMKLTKNLYYDLYDYDLDNYRDVYKK